MMPEESGFDILRSLHVELVPLPPVIMLSAVIGLQQRLEAQELGVTQYMTKPTTPKQLVDAIHRVLENAREKGKRLQNTQLPPKTYSN